MNIKRSSLSHQNSVQISRKSLKRKYSTFDEFKTSFNISDDEFSTFLLKAEDEDIDFTEEEIAPNSEFIRLQLKALIARNLYEVGDYFEVLAPLDPEVSKALEVINDGDLYLDLLGKQ